MVLGQAGKALIQSFEQCRLVAYPDQKGIPTIAWGHTGGVQLGDTCTQAQADTWFIQDTQFACRAVLNDTDVPLTQNQFDALVSFTFNVGAGSLAHSTMLKLINQSNFSAAAGQFSQWNHVDGVVDPGLTRRRAAECALFLQG